MKIYTRTGDQGETALLGGQRVLKSTLRIEAYGTVDELNAALGVSIATVEDPEVRDLLVKIQQMLFILGAELAVGDKQGEFLDSIPRIAADHVTFLEQRIDVYEQVLPSLNQFVLPGGTMAGGLLHLARTICRRAERCVVALAQKEEVSPEVLRFLNRLSDLLFVLARWVNHRAGVPEVRWQGVRREG